MSKKISVLFIGDIVGKPGMKAVSEHLGTLIDKYKADFVIVNGENVCNGKGLTEVEAKQLFALGADLITTGNHIWDNWKSRPLLASDAKVLRGYNYPPGNVGRGYMVLEKEGVKLAVLQLQGRTFMNSIDCPFRGAESALNKIHERTKNIIVDFHADATAEKVSMGWYLDGKVSAMFGTHTHIQTADATVLPNGTAYITDVGMTGPYDSVVGMRKDVAYKRFRYQTPHKYELASGDEKIAGANVVIDADSGSAISIESFILPKFITSIYEQLEM